MIFAEVGWETVAAIAIGLAVMGLILWMGLRNRTADRTRGADQSTGAPAPNLISRVVSWTSMIHRGGYRGPTRSLHRKGGSVDVLIATETRPDSPVKSWVLERSINTMTLVADEPVEAGTVAKVRPLSSPDNIGWIEINVHECSEEENQWRITCRFVKVPPYNILMLFG